MDHRKNPSRLISTSLSPTSEKSQSAFAVFARDNGIHHGIIGPLDWSELCGVREASRKMTTHEHGKENQENRKKK
jgi:hypothetical protein